MSNTMQLISNHGIEISHLYRVVITVAINLTLKRLEGEECWTRGICLHSGKLYKFAVNLRGSPRLNELTEQIVRD